MLYNSVMQNLRKYGDAPFRVAVIHGGPGAPGEMAPVARELSGDFGVLEPLQTATSLESQLQELHDVLESSAELPVKLIGWSWGAMLSFIFAARFPKFVEKLILVSSGSFEAKYASKTMETRLSRLSGKDRIKMRSLMEALNDPAATDKNKVLAQFGKMISKADSYKPLPVGDELLECQYEIYQSVWKEAEELRSSGQLLELGKRIECPVVAIHGDYDPRPPEGVNKPLSRVLKNFRFILLDNCGHYPWVEEEAKDRFYSILRECVR